MRKTHQYEVIVGNIGTVYSGDNERMAILYYHSYIAQSKSGRGLAAKEPVTLTEDGEPLQEYDPSDLTSA